MTDEQRKAQELWLASATYDTDFKPMTMPALVKILHDEYEILTSTSAVGRWKQKFKWEELLEVQIATATLEDEKIKDMISASTMKEGSEKIFDDFKANESIKNGSYNLAARQLKHYEKIMDTKGHLSEKDMKQVIELLKLTSDREDKLLDRQAMLSAAKLLKSDDVLKELNSHVVNVEDVIEIEIDE